jgi:molybdopterin converting factor small subunit
MKIQVEYTAQLRDCVGAEIETVALEAGATLASLLQVLARKHGDAASALLLDAAGQPSPSVLCFVELEQVDGSRILSDGETVTLLTPVSGG